jgi:hypothetical protein
MKKVSASRIDQGLMMIAFGMGLKASLESASGMQGNEHE